MKFSYTLPLMGLVVFACHGPESSSVKDAWNEANNPVVMMAVKNEFERDYTKLPQSGFPEKMPWSDDYWASYLGGISYRWNDAKSLQLKKAARNSSDQEFAGQLDDDAELQKLRTEVLGYRPYAKEELEAMEEKQRSELIATLSPAEKLDIYRGDYSYPTVKLERERTNIIATLRSVPGEGEESQSLVDNPAYKKGTKIPTWFGICHAWAPATILFAEPGPVTLKNKDGFEVPMAASDVKALLSHAIDRTPSQQKTRSFLAERCNNDLSPKTEKALFEIMDVLEPGRVDLIDQQIKALLEMDGVDFVTKLAVASHFYKYAPSEADAKAGFQKLFENMQARLRPGSADRNKLASIYAEAVKGLAGVGDASKLNQDEVKKAAAQAVFIGACNDTNAGAFHLVITNSLGIQKKSFGIDVTRDAEVWNQAAAGFRSKVLKTFTGDEISDAAAVGTVKELLIQTEFLYTTEKAPAWNRFGDDMSRQSYHVAMGDVYKSGGREFRALRYRIELDSLNRIIGGSWEGNTRPDFLWGTGNFIWSREYDDIEDIYYQSIGH